MARAKPRATRLAGITTIATWLKENYAKPLVVALLMALASRVASTMRTSILAWMIRARIAVPAWQYRHERRPDNGVIAGGAKATFSARNVLHLDQSMASDSKPRLRPKNDFSLYGSLAYQINVSSHINDMVFKHFPTTTLNAGSLQQEEQKSSDLHTIGRKSIIRSKVAWRIAR